MTLVLDKAVCEECGKEFEKNRANKRFCSRPCTTKSYARHNFNAIETVHLSNATTGACSELAVSIDLIFRGYQVFRAVSPACHCDLIAEHNGTFLRIEVRAGAMNKKTGNLGFTRNSKVRNKKYGEETLDHYAVVIYENRIPSITYYPLFLGS